MTDDDVAKYQKEARGRPPADLDMGVNRAAQGRREDGVEPRRVSSIRSACSAAGDSRARPRAAAARRPGSGSPP